MPFTPPSSGYYNGPIDNFDTVFPERVGLADGDLIVGDTVSVTDRNSDGVVYALINFTLPLGFLFLPNYIAINYRLAFPTLVPVGSPPLPPAPESDILYTPANRVVDNQFQMYVPDTWLANDVVYPIRPTSFVDVFFGSAPTDPPPSDPTLTNYKYALVLVIDEYDKDK